MGHSSLLGPDSAPLQPEGRDNAALGPSDSSDSGSDRTGLADTADSDEAGSGERRSVDGTEAEGRDIGVDRVYTPGNRRHAADRDSAADPLHDGVDDEIDLVDAAVAPDPLEDEEPGDGDGDDDEDDDSEDEVRPGGLQDEGDNIPGGPEPDPPA